MSHRRTRARKRRARNELAHALKEARRAGFQVEFQESLKRVWSANNSVSRVEMTGKLVDLIHRIAASDIRVFPFLNVLNFTTASFSKLAAEERAEIQAMFAQAVEDTNRHGIQCGQSAAENE